MQTSSQPGNKAEAGGALVEVLIAIAIGGLAIGSIGFGLPRLQAGMNERNIDRRLVSLVERARYRALSEQRTIELISSEERLALEPKVGKDDLFHLGGIEVSFLSALELSTAQRGAIHFLPNGHSSGGEIKIGASGDTRSFRIDWATSRIVQHGK